MKILYIHQYFTTPEMKGGTRSYEIARRLAIAGYTTVMITTDRSPKQCHFRHGSYQTTEAGVQVHWIPVPYSNELGFAARIQAFLSFAIRASHLAASIEADIIFATSTPLTVAIPAIYAARRQLIPMIFEVRDLWPEVPIAIGVLKNPILIKLAKLLEKIAYRYSAKVIALSPSMKQGVVKAGYPSKRVLVVPNSADIQTFRVHSEIGLEFRSRYNWLGDKPLVVYTGTIGFINNLGYMVRLAAKMAEIDPDVRFLIVGSGKEEAEIRQIAASKNVLNKNFFMFPAVKKNEVPAVLSAATIATSFVLNIEATWGNSANKVFDAFAAGRPVAINHGGWLAEILESSGAGIQLHSSDMQAAACLLSSKIRDRKWLEKAKNASCKLADGPFSRDHLTKKILGVLDQVAIEFKKKNQNTDQSCRGQSRRI